MSARKPLLPLLSSPPHEAAGAGSAAAAGAGSAAAAGAGSAAAGAGTALDTTSPQVL
jgi:hypothetical protein